MNATMSRPRPTLVTRASGSEIVQVLSYDRTRDEVTCVIQDARSRGSEYGYCVDALSIDQIGARDTTFSAAELVEQRARVVINEDSRLIKGRL